MTAPGSIKRRRRRERRFVAWHETLSTRGAVVGVIATLALLAWQAARTLLR